MKRSKTAAILFLAACLPAAAAVPETPGVRPAEADSAVPGANVRPAPSVVRPARYVYSDYVPSCLLSPAEMQRRFAFTSPSFSPVLFSWGSGGIVAAGSATPYPGMAGVESGSLHAVQSVGNMTFTAYGRATKIGYFRGLSTQWTVGGSASWQFAPRLGLTVFGSYSTRGYVRGMSPAVAEMLSTPQFGGYLSWDITDHWGVDVGAVTQQNNLRRWETRPIVAPYYRNGSTKISVDVGGIIYEAIRSRTSGYGNPTIGPPKPVIPIAPRD